MNIELKLQAKNNPIFNGILRFDDPEEQKLQS